MLRLGLAAALLTAGTLSWAGVKVLVPQDEEKTQKPVAEKPLNETQKAQQALLKERIKKRDEMLQKKQQEHDAFVREQRQKHEEQARAQHQYLQELQRKNKQN
jgi:hypothetical protein